MRHGAAVVTVQEFAERVLLGTTLEEKLAPPSAGIVDGGLVGRIVLPEMPGRPEGMELRRDGVRAEFPGTTGIEDDAHRGRLLHFFANHELLAVELMALVLLKFPEAPAEFRAGILKTLKEEQMHTKLYLRRMEECGVRFGDLPLNGFFWNAVAPMPTPVDYVTRLSLTFEQANLDYSRGYAGVFAAAGDGETAAVLERVYRDEIAHVHYGLKWFREWKEGGVSDWEAYRSRLSLPLSAARAKGAFGFNEEGRREAGLDEEFIRELRVYAQSKGRTPNIHWFNPGAEESLVAGWEETAAARQVGRDLALLPAFLARKEDVVVVPELPPTAHLERLLEAGIEVPECVAWGEAEKLRERKLGEVRPWARTPDAEEFAERVGLELVRTAAALFSKAESAGLLRKLVERSKCPLLCGEEVVGREAGSMEAVEEVLRETGGGRVVIKAPFSTAGRDRLLRETTRPWSGKERAWVERVLAGQGCVVVERWMDRILDFSIQYERKGEGLLRRLGYVVLENTRQGQFRSARVPGRLTDGLPEDVRRALFDGSPRGGHLAEFLEGEFEPEFAQWLGAQGYEGPVGVDAFFYREEDGTPRIKPVVEVNPRYTMGRLVLELARRNGEGTATRLRIGKVSEGAEAGEVPLTPEREGAVFGAWVKFG
ncbi:MAG: DUF455 family protein [Verrucomicrobia bacterium]|nr:DUF455 family protein [Verrucomicrobiota bacterium]